MAVVREHHKVRKYYKLVLGHSLCNESSEIRSIEICYIQQNLECEENTYMVVI